ncbi:MAG: deoxyguanosinetriphosphate triphosphohydrolase [bacterium]|nr:deoxyguanosinetriphosphate triphosphohydrolase [bacterium]
MREAFEERELQELSPLAAKSSCSKGRRVEEPHSFNRTCFQRDRDRIVHSKAFRRLKHKTQVFVAYESDHFRSRLTHTIEVAQISRHLARLLRLNEDLSEAIALAHDLGHTPFGHAGEKTLNKLMENHGGFEHNLHSLRIVDVLEQRYPLFKGLNLTQEVREGLMKHSTPYDHPNSDSMGVTLEAQVTNLADEISYNNHDLDDGLSAGILSDTELDSKISLWRDAKLHVSKQYTNLSIEQLRFLINSHLISQQIEDVATYSLRHISEQNIDTFEALQQTTKALVRFSPEMTEKSRELRTYLFTQFYTHHSVYRMNKKGQNIIKDLFIAFVEDRKLLPRHYQDCISSEYPLERVVCDYIAGMTDTYAEKEYDTIFR